MQGGKRREKSRAKRLPLKVVSCLPSRAWNKRVDAQKRFPDTEIVCDASLQATCAGRDERLGSASRCQARVERDAQTLHGTP